MLVRIQCGVPIANRKRVLCIGAHSLSPSVDNTMIVRMCKMSLVNYVQYIMFYIVYM